jgi:hypothetical protein
MKTYKFTNCKTQTSALVNAKNWREAESIICSAIGEMWNSYQCILGFRFYGSSLFKGEMVR